MNRTNKPYIKGLKRGTYKIFLGEPNEKVCKPQNSTNVDSG